MSVRKRAWVWKFSVRNPTASPADWMAVQVQVGSEVLFSGVGEHIAAEPVPVIRPQRSVRALRREEFLSAQTVINGE
jgi:hypothetical protein